ncbi:hypothetical protein OWR28_17420 [Chryseobacterium sp. 1B4]
MEELYECLVKISSPEKFIYYKSLEDSQKVFVKIISNYNIFISDNLSFEPEIHNFKCKNAIKDSELMSFYEKENFESISIYKFNIKKENNKIYMQLFVDGYPDYPIEIIGKEIV